MIFHLNGTLSLKTDDFIVVECSGVGYQIYIPYNMHAKLPSHGTPLQIFTYHHIREDNQQLFGFASIEDREFFMLLTSVSGVGPKVGLKILSEFSTDELAQAIMTGNLAVLTQVPGVGKKVAERLVIELKDKLSKLNFVVSPDSPSGSSLADSLNREHEQDLLLALKTLGYSSDEIKRAIASSSGALESGMTLEQSIKVLLKHL